MSVDPLADLAVAAVFEALAIPMTYRPRYGEPAVVRAVQVRPPPATCGGAGGGGIQGGQRRLIGAGVRHRAIVAFLAQGHEIKPLAGGVT